MKVQCKQLALANKARTLMTGASRGKLRHYGQCRPLRNALRGGEGVRAQRTSRIAQ
jgi:hypothetical protein